MKTTWIFRRFLNAARNDWANSGRRPRCLTEKMLTYAIGRELEPGDRPAIDSILKTIPWNWLTLPDVRQSTRSRPSCEKCLIAGWCEKATICHSRRMPTKTLKRKPNRKNELARCSVIPVFCCPVRLLPYCFLILYQLLCSFNRISLLACWFQNCDTILFFTLTMTNYCWASLSADFTMSFTRCLLPQIAACLSSR